MSSQRTLYGLAAVSIVAIILSGASLALLTSGTTSASIQPTERTFYLSAIEPKGTTSVSKEPFPTQSLPDGGGYKLTEPDKDGNWVASTYIWVPSVLTVYQGDRVTLMLFGVNGAVHPTEIEGYGIKFEVKRGQLTTVEFVADKVGTFEIHCDVHQPAMTGTLVVLPRV